MVVAVGIAAHASGGIAVALLASTNVVAGAGAELRAVEGFEETTAPDLARNGSESILCCGGTGGGVLRGVGDAGTGAAIRIANQNAACIIDRDVVEIEKIAARIAAAAIPDAAALHRIRRRCIDRRPGSTGVISEGDIEVPYAEKVG